MKKKEYKKNGYIRNKYLEELGLKPNEYSTNFCKKSDCRWKSWKKQRDKYGFDERETWALNNKFYEWLYSRLQMYLDYARGIIDLTYYKFEYTPTGSTESVTVTQEEAINIIKEEAKRMILQDEWDDNAKPFDENIMILFCRVLPALWW